MAKVMAYSIALLKSKVMAITKVMATMQRLVKNIAQSSCSIFFLEQREYLEQRE